VRFGELTPLLVNVHAEPGTPTTLDKGTTITMALPVRGNVQVRVEQLSPDTATLVTIAGHPLAGAIRFLAESISGLIRFQVQIYDRAANLADWLVMRTIGDEVQARSWESLLQAIVKESGATSASPIQHEEIFLDEARAERVEEWVKEIVIERKRAQHAAEASQPKRPHSPSRTNRRDESFGEDAIL
jgi:NADH dehydrogenase